MAKKITYNIEDIDFKIGKKTGNSPESLGAKKLNTWIEKVAEKEGKQLGTISYIFCSDDYLLKMNIEYLNHDTLTDIITFPYNNDPIEGDIFISIERVKDNAQDYKVNFETELHRVMIHGILHLCGYKDKTKMDALLMRQKEDESLILLGLEAV